MACIKPNRYHERDIACGQCMPCRLARAKEWATRVKHHTETTQKNNLPIMVTLTYNPENVPENGSTRTPDIQKFWKKVRKQQKNIGNEGKIEYIACSEYGTQTERAHYHAILMGFKENFTKNPKTGEFRRVSITETIEKIWGKGHITCRIADDGAVQYVCQYITKKLNGERGKTEYEDKGREEPKLYVSQGLGKEWAIQHAKELKDNMGIMKWINTPRGKERKNIGMPRYYKKVLGIETREFDKKRLELEREMVEKFAKIGIPTTHDEVKKVRAGNVPVEMMECYADYHMRYGQLPTLKEAKENYAKMKQERKQAYKNLMGRGGRNKV